MSANFALCIVEGFRSTRVEYVIYIWLGRRTLGAALTLYSHVDSACFLNLDHSPMSTNAGGGLYGGLKFSNATSVPPIALEADARNVGNSATDAAPMSKPAEAGGLEESTAQSTSAADTKAAQKEKGTAGGPEVL